MAFGSSSYGSTAYAGSAGSPNPLVIPPTQALSLTLHAPFVLIEHEPGTLIPNLTLHAPTISITHVVATPQTLALTQHPSTPFIQVEPATFALALSGLSVHIPTIVISSAPGTLNMGIYAEFNPHIGSLQPQIVKFIKDPVVTGGCAQCGTLLWATHSRTIPIDSGRVSIGRNKDLNEGLPDDRYQRCARCGWINNKNRATSHQDGSKSGWGITYNEFEVTPDSPLTNTDPNNEWFENKFT